jgi:hypothetical protein
MCPRTAIYVSSYYYNYAVGTKKTLFFSLVPTVQPLSLVHHYICVLILLYVSSYYYIFVLILLYVSSYYYICVLILLYMCPHTSIYVSSYCYTRCCPAGTKQNAPLSLVHHYICVLILVYMCPHTTICVSSKYYMCVLIVVYVSSY